jgi:hypothetical protein
MAALGRICRVGDVWQLELTKSEGTTDLDAGLWLEVGVGWWLC